MCIKFEEPKIHHAKKSRRFIQKKVHQKRKRFIKHTKVQVHWGKKEVYKVHQNDQKSLSWEILGGQKVPKSSFNQEMKDQKKEKNK